MRPTPDILLIRKHHNYRFLIFFFLAPAVVPAPTIIDVGREKQRKFTVILPDEANGPIRLPS